MNTAKELISDDGKTSIPMEDIHRFTIYHQLYQYGLKLKAYVNPELCTVIDSEGKVLKEGKYKQFKVYEHDLFCAGSRVGTRDRISREIANGFMVLGKYNKCRTKLMTKVKKEAAKKQNKNVVMTGMSSGYATTSNYLELQMEVRK